MKCNSNERSKRNEGRVHIDGQKYIRATSFMCLGSIIHRQVVKDVYRTKA